MFIIPVIGGYIADTLAGKYNTILGSGLIYVLGKFKWQNLKITETVLQFTTVLAFIYKWTRAQCTFSLRAILRFKNFWRDDTIYIDYSSKQAVIY